MSKDDLRCEDISAEPPDAVDRGLEAMAPAFVAITREMDKLGYSEVRYSIEGWLISFAKEEADSRRKVLN